MSGEARPGPVQRRLLIEHHHHIHRALAGTAHKHPFGPRLPWWERVILWFGHTASWPSRLHPAHLASVVVRDGMFAGLALVVVAATFAIVRYRGSLAFTGFARSTRPSQRRRFQVLLPESFVRDGLFGFFGTVAFLLRPVVFGRPSSLVFTLTEPPRVSRGPF